jgi:alpha-beta hydrolase superfamily lysophospholipase
VSVPDTGAHLETVIRDLDRPPFLMGHSYGGLLTQLLLDRGLGAAGVAIDSAPPEGVRKVPLAQLKALFPAFENPANRHRAVPFTAKHFHYACTDTLSEEKSAAVYERYHVAAPGRFIWDGFLSNVQPGRQDTWVNFENDQRAPLLFIAGGVDHVMPAAVNRANFEHYKSAADTEYKEYDGRSHFTVGRPRLGGSRRLRAQLVQRAHRSERAGEGVARGGARRVPVACVACSHSMPGVATSRRISGCSRRRPRSLRRARSTPTASGSRR